MIIVQLAGRLGKDPETRFTATGQKVTTFSVAVGIKKGGKEETVWWRVTVWGDRFEKMMPYLKKGSAVIVTGEMNRGVEMYTDKEGRQQVSPLEITAEIIKFSPFGNPDKSGQDQASAQGSASGSSKSSQNHGQDSSFGEFAANGAAGYGASGSKNSSSDDEMPF